MAYKNCLKKSPPNGICKAAVSDGLQGINDLETVKGTWLILKGLNCGQEGWSAGFDYYPCQSDRIYKKGSTWLDRIDYCGGKNNTCTTPMVHTLASLYFDPENDGVMKHIYLGKLKSNNFRCPSSSPG
jgi:hypothetical protein